jgi:3-oxoacyl-[acyl-carrier protein] reductase
MPGSKMDIRGKKAVVTGGAGGIGRVLVEKLVKEKVAVGAFDINQETLDALKGEFPDIWCRACDITDNRQVEEAVAAFYDEFKSIDILVNNAGMIDDHPLIGFSEGRFKKHDAGAWNRVIAANLSSTFYVTSSVVEKMVAGRTKGVIINVSSISASGNIGQSAYSAAKAGVSALMVTWAKELGGFGIRVAGIAPGFTGTDAIKKAMTEAAISDWTKKVPLQRLATPEEIVDGILFIIKNDYFNGRILELDGGLRI